MDSSLSSDMVLWQRTRGFPDYAGDNIPIDKLIWATAAMKHSTSGFHVAQVNSTEVGIMARKQYWVIARPRRDHPIDLASLEMFARLWDQSTALTEDFQLEGILLKPGMIL
jgi:hypothetical protein